MDIYKPRKRIALNVDTIGDSEVREALTNLSNLQKEVSGMNNGFSSQINAGIQEAQAMIDKMNKTNQELDQTLNTIKTQIEQLTNSALQYIQSNNSELQDTKPKYRDSFIYLTKEATANLSQLVEGLKTQVGNILVSQSPVETNIDQPGTTDMSPDELLTASLVIAAKEHIRRRVAIILPEVMKTVEKLEPIINQANTVNQNNEKLVAQLQEVVGTVPLATQTVVEETDAFTPAPTQQPPQEEENIQEEDLTQEDVEAAEEVEGGLDVNMPTVNPEISSQEENTGEGEEAEEEAIQEDTEEEKEEPAQKEENIEEEIVDDEDIIEEETEEKTTEEE